MKLTIKDQEILHSKLRQQGSLTQDGCWESIEVFEEFLTENYIVTDIVQVLEDILADLKLRASLSEEPDVLNISSSLLIRADKLIAKVRGEE